MNNLIVGLLVISFFTIRPAALGNQYSSISIIIQILALGIYIITRKKDAQIKRKKMKVLALISFFWLFSLIQGVIVNTKGIEFLFKATILSVITAITFGVILSNKKLNEKFFRTIFYILKIAVVSWIITVIISFIIPIETLQIGQMKIEGYETSGKIYFPFTILYGFMTVGTIKLPRLLILFREAGITQMILIWFLFNLKSYGLENKRNKLIMIIGIIGTFSTTGIVILITTYAIKCLIECKSFIQGIKLIITISIIPVVLLFTPYIGIKDKIMTHGASITERTSSMIAGINKFIDNPLGAGLYSDIGVQNANINFISSMYSIGIIGIILYLSIFIFYIENKEDIILLSPIIITILFTQPLIDAPMIYIFLYSNYRNKKTIEKGELNGKNNNK